MQVDPIKPTLIAPGLKLLKLKCNEPPSNFAFKFDLHHYTSGRRIDQFGNAKATLVFFLFGLSWYGGAGQGLTFVHFSAQPQPFLPQIHSLILPDTP